MQEEYSTFFEYYKDDTIFSSINKNFISLQDAEIKENNRHLRRILEDGLIPKMKKNDLFNEMYKKIKYAGSYYKGTKVGKPNEYDLDLIVQLPLNYMTLKFETNHEHYGYVKIKVEENDKLPEWKKHSKILNTWIDGEGYLNQDKFRQWMESVMTKTFDQLEKSGREYELTIDDETYLLKRFSKSGPAFTVYIRLKSDSENNEIMSVDIVPSLEFNGRILENYKPTPSMISRTTPSFVVIPKPLHKIMINGHNLWRLSFYDQEKKILSEFTQMKPIIRMLKKFRDRHEMKPISSYFIETIFLHQLSRRESDSRFFRGPLTGLFMFMLEILSRVLCAKHLPFFWHEGHNLLSHLDEKVMKNYGYRIQNILASIEKRYTQNRFIIAEQILTVEEFANLLTKIAGENPGSNSSAAELTEGTSYDMTDGMLKNYNLDELTPAELRMNLNNMQGKLSPEVIEEVENACNSYVRTEEKSSYFKPFTQFLNKALSPHTLIHGIPILLEILHGNRNRDAAEITDITLYKPQYTLPVSSIREKEKEKDSFE